MIIEINIPRPKLTLLVLLGIVGFVAWSYQGGQTEHASITGGPDATPQEEIQDAEWKVRQARQQREVLERKEEILRFQLKQVEQEMRTLTGAQLTAMQGELAESAEKLRTLLQNKRAAEQYMLEALYQIWDAQKRAGQISIAATEAVDALIWPMDPKHGISAGFLDKAYEKRFGIPHKAIDIPAEQGTPIGAAAGGVVEVVKDNGLGFSYIIIKHKGLATLYGHISEFLVAEGDQVTAGQSIALSGGMPGTNGAGPLSTGPHLHFETIVQGEKVDPLTLLP